MSSELLNFQINYDNALKDQAYKNALSKKIHAKIEELKSSQTSADKLIAFRAKVQKEALQEHCKSLENYIQSVIKRHQEFTPYKHYKDDLKINIDTLTERKQQYSEAYDALTLVYLNKEGDVLRPKSWSLDTSAVILPPAFKPIANRSAASHSASETISTAIRYEKKYDYSFASFCYADDGTVLDHRFFLYWGLSESTFEQQSKDKETYRPDQLFAAYAIGGFATKLNIDSRLLNNRTRLEGDEHFNKRYTLSRPINPQYIGEKNDFSASYRLSDTRIQLNKLTGFFLYPLDQTPFTTNKLFDLAELEAPQYPSYLSTHKVVFSGGDNPAPQKVYLHCSLPEWNYRLRKALTDLQLQIKEYNLLLSPHFSKLSEVAMMRETLELHTRHCFNDPNHSAKLSAASPLRAAIGKVFQDEGTTDSQLESRKRLADTLDDLYEGIQTIIDAPNRINTATELLYNEKKDIDECAKKLWELMQSPAFKAELTSYIDYVKTQDQDIEPGSGIIPCGPYMAKDENWDTIFYTIAECYAGLSASEQYRDLVWNEDIVHGIDLITTIGHKGDTAKLINKDWLDLNDGTDKALYLGEQYKDLTTDQGSSGQTLFTLIAENYSTFLKPYLGHVIPGPGAPCTLQVILSCYQPQVFSHILNTVRKDITYHIRLFRGVSMLFGILNENKPEVDRLLGRDVRDIFSAFIVTKDLRKSRGRAEKTTKAFAAYFAAAAEDGAPKGPSEKLYQKTVLQNERKLVSHGASYGKSIYTLFNLVLSIQTLQALDEVAKDKGWSEERLFLEHTYAITQVAMAAGTSTMAMLNVAKRINYLGASNSVTKGVTGAIHKGLGDLLDTATIHITVLASVLSAYQAAEHIQNQRYREAVYSGVAASANIMLSAGFVIKRAAKQAASNAAKRAAAQLVVSGVTAATGVGAPLAGIFIIVGTAVNIAMLAYDTATLFKTLLASNAQKMLVSQWQNFQQPAPELTVAMLENFGLKRTRGSDWSATVWSLEHNAFLNHSDDIIKLYNTTPYEIYTGKHGGWQNTTLTVEPIKIIEDLHNQEVFDTDGVRLGKLSWRAVVPLHNLGIPADTIDKVVDFGISLYDELFTHGMESASDIIAYYQEVHQNWSSALVPAAMPDNYNIETETKELKHIAILLEEGHFTPPRNAVFHRAVDWKHPTFQIPDRKLNNV